MTKEAIQTFTDDGFEAELEDWKQISPRNWTKLCAAERRLNTPLRQLMIRWVDEKTPSRTISLRLDIADRKAIDKLLKLYNLHSAYVQYTSDYAKNAGKRFQSTKRAYYA